MKVISLHQPHALLAVYGFKTIETRAMDTRHRGWVAIHATKQWPDETRAMLSVYPTTSCLEMIDRERAMRGWEPFLQEPPHEGHSRPPSDYDDLPRGAIVGVAWLAKTERTDGIAARWNQTDRWFLSAPDYADVPRFEASFGDYANGRRAWWLCHPIPLREPVRVDGWPGLWDTRTAAERDNDRGSANHTGGPDRYEAAVYGDLFRQGVTLPDMVDPGLWRTINRRGETDASRPRERA